MFTKPDVYFCARAAFFSKEEGGVILQEECRVLPFQAAPSYGNAILRRVRGGNTDFWEVFRDREFPDVLMTRPGDVLYVPEEMS